MAGHTRSASERAHPFYTRLNRTFDDHHFDEFVEGLCERFYADEGRPGLPTGRYFRLLLIGYFETHEAVFTWMLQATRRRGPLATLTRENSRRANESAARHASALGIQALASSVVASMPTVFPFTWHQSHVRYMSVVERLAIAESGAVRIGVREMG